MKVLMLGWELPPHNSGGLGIACYQLCEALTDKGVDIEFVLPYTADHDIDFMPVHAAHPQDVQAVIKSGIAYDSFKYMKNSGDVEHIDLIGQSIIYEKAVERIAKIAQFDVIHAHDWLTCRAALRAKEISGKPMFVHVHSVESDRAGSKRAGNPLVQEVENIAMLLAERIIAVSNHTKEAIMHDYGIPETKIDVVYNSFDPRELISGKGQNEYAYLQQMKDEGYKIVASIGRLTIQKGLPNLLQAFAKTIEHLPKSILLVVGSGEQYFELVGMTAQLGISKNVIFTDFQRGKKYRDAYTIADLFVLPSISEPFGLTPLEAIGYGTPTLVSKQAGVSEVLHNCLKVDFWDVDEMANQMVAALSSEALRSEIHKNSLVEYDKMSWNHAADKLFDVYHKHKEAALV